MRISSLNIVDILKRQLLSFGELVDCLRDKDINFVSKFENWLRTSESILKENNIAECSELAGLRSKIIAPIYGFSRTPSIRRQQLKVAAEILYEAQNTLLEVLKPHEIKVNESRALVFQLLNIVKQTNVIEYNHDIKFQDFIEKIWSFFITHEQLKPGMTKILTLVSQMDARRLIAEEINLTEWKIQDNQIK